MAEIKATREYDFEKDPAYQIDKDEKGYRMRVDANGRWIAIKDNEVVYSTFCITDDEIICAIPESNGKTKFIRQPNPEANPLEELAATRIQIYDHPELKERIGESLFYTRPELKEVVDGRWIFEDYDSDKKAPIPVAAMLRECIRNKLAKKNGSNPGMDQILGAVNELRDGTLEEQAIYGLFREHLIENGFMPVDEKGKPYDLSVMHIPAFDVNAVVTCPDKPLKNSVLSYYQLNRENTEEIRQEDFMRCMNKMKLDNPDLFVNLHNYLADAELIPKKSPMLAKLDLAPEQIDYLRHLETPAVEDAFNYFNSIISETIRAKTGKTLVFWNIRDQSREWVESYAPQINRVLANMKFGSVDEQREYHDFCIAISEIKDMVFAEDKPSYPEKAKTMFERAQAKRARATIETLL